MGELGTRDTYSMASTCGMGWLMEEIFMGQPGPDISHLFTQRWLEHISLASSSQTAV